MYLEDSNKWLGKRIKMAAWLVEINVKVKTTTEHLHTEQGKNDDKEKEQE